MAQRVDFAVFDADNHLYETEDSLTRYLPATRRDLIRFVEVRGRKKLVVRDRLTEFIPNPTFEVVARPGAHMAFYAGDNPEGRSLRELTGTPMASIPAFREPGARLSLLDEQGIAAALMFPTLGSLVEQRLIDDPALTQIAIRAFNEWLHDQWGYHEGRIYTTPIVNPSVLDDGIAELERVVERGARAVLMRPAPVSGLRGTRSPFLPEFDPFWARVQEMGVLVALHASDSGYQDYLNTWEGSEGAEYVAFRPKTFAAVADGGRSIQDTLASAVCHGMLTRFPGVRLLSVENGGSWVGLLLRNLELAYKKMPNEFPEHPRDVFHRNVWVNPFWEDSVTGLVDLIGADRVCFGSDYPHPEGLDDPVAWRHELDGVPAADVEKIMSTNMFGLLGVTPPATLAA
jgi:predicted TIM-barrel fold metal-dependent hydrolase